MARVAASANTQFRTLITLRRRLAFRQFKGRKNEVVAALILPLIFIPILIFAAVGL